MGNSGGADGMGKLNKDQKAYLKEMLYFTASLIILTTFFSYLLIGAFI